MKRLNIIAAVSVLIAFACAIPFFIGWNPEALFKFNEPPVSIRDIKPVSYTHLDVYKRQPPSPPF